MNNIASPATAAKTDLPNPNALLFFLSHQDTYRKPLFSRKEIFCGPDTDQRVAATKTFAIKAPLGSYDVADVLRHVPAEQQPEIVIVKADATRRNFPRNLSRFSCPKILLVGDTHHYQTPLQDLISYAKEEPFDFIVFDHTRHHAHWFAQAGLKNLHWLPAVDFGFTPRELKATPSRPLTFVGQVGQHHPYRRWVLDQVKAANLPLETLRGTLAQTADIYADSQVTLNVSLNGDLNLRVFEALAAGGFLLTDELSEASGLPLLFESGKHLDTWRTPGELVEKIQHYLANPAEAQRIRAAGQAELLRAHHPEVKLREFYDLVFNGRVNPRYDLKNDPRVARVLSIATPASLGDVKALAGCYETIQGLHRSSRLVTVFAGEGTVKGLSAIADLPRLRVASLASCAEINGSPVAQRPALESDAAAVHVLWWDAAAAAEKSLAATMTHFSGSHVIAPAASEADRTELAAWGFQSISEGAEIFVLSDPMLALKRAWESDQREAVRARLLPLLNNSQNSADCLALAEYAGQLEDFRLYKDALQKAIALDRNNQSALLQLASLAIEREEYPSACIVLEEAARVALLPPEMDALRSQLLVKTIETPVVESYFRTTGRLPIEPAQPRRKILLVTNLFPPQELGGYGRMMWEFAHGLRTRGHEVRVLAGDAPYLAKKKSADEAELDKHVTRRLELLGSWQDGKVELITDQKKANVRANANARRILEAAKELGADFILAGNLDLIGHIFLNQALEAGIPVLHALANAEPGYPVAAQPRSPIYWVAPCSNWNGEALRQNGYEPGRVETLYPGARIDRFFRFFMPAIPTLRICYASLVLPYKGAHVLVEALAELHQRGVPFTAEIAGDTTDVTFLERLKDFVSKSGMDGKVTFPGFLDRAGLGALFARSNVLVFPSQFAEPFGISQVEAMAAGLVVVSSGTGGAKEIIRHGVDGLRFNPTDPGDLAAKLHSLATQTQLFAQLQQAAPTRAVEFSVDGAVHRIEQLAGELLVAKQQFQSAPPIATPV